MKPDNIYLVRHGQSIGNVDHSVYATLQDWDIPLTTLGEEQARNIAQVLNAEIGGGSVALYHSPYRRARQTSAHIRAALNIMSVREDVRLREQDHGHWVTLEKRHKIFDERARFGKFFYRVEDGESPADVYDRISTFLGTMFRSFEKTDFPRNVVIVSHGMTMRVFLMRWLHWTVEEFYVVRNPPNCGVYHFARNGEKFVLQTELERDHAVQHASACSFVV